MTIPMDDGKEISSRERVHRLFNENVEMENKRTKAAQTRIPSDPNTWQKMRENYEAIILEEHAFSEQHDVEYALWQLHYKRIEELRAFLNAALASAGKVASQNGKNPGRAGPDRVTKIRSQFKNFLSEASGFYHDLMLKIRAKYGLPLGYISDYPDNQILMSKDGKNSSEVKKGLISCHRCLIYLGDLARYKSLYGEGDPKARDFAAASSYYTQASSLWPSSGNPYHQLAILSGYSNDELLSIYCYFRSLAVDNPFITARDNLIIAFEKNRQNYIQQLGDAKTTTVKTTPSRMPGKGRGKGEPRPSFKDKKVEAIVVKEKASNKFELFKTFVTKFVRMNGVLFTCTSLETFSEVFKMVKNDLLELLSPGPDDEFNFGLDVAECRLAVIRMVAILIFTVHNVKKENENQSYADILQRSVLLQNAFTATFEFMGCILEWCNQLNDPSSSCLLPGIMVFVEWLACHQDVAVGSELDEKQVNAKSFFWNKCISVLNKILTSGAVIINEDETCFSNMSEYDENETANHPALPEDFELRGFLPLVPAQVILDFSRKHSYGGNKEKIARVQRIIAAGKALANVVRVGEDGIYFDTKLKKFVFGEPHDFDDDYLVTSHLEPSLSVRPLDISVGGQIAQDDVSKIEVGMESEEEDEVIVFKPFASSAEKHMPDFSPKLPSSEVLASVVEAGRMDNGNENGSFSVALDNFLLQGALSGSMKPSATMTGTVANGHSQYLQPVQTSMSKSPVEHTPIANGVAHLNLLSNGAPLKHELQDKFGISQTAPFSMPYPPSVNAAASHNYSFHIPQSAAPSMFDSVMSSGASVDGLQPSSLMPLGLKKNPVSRPVRHFGPPPGFSSVPSKVVDEPSYDMALRAETPIPQMDDHGWLDGYKLSSSNQSLGLSSSMNQVGPLFPSMSNNNGPMGIGSFPFPGKQVSTPQFQSEHHFSEHMKQYEQQQQLLNGKQQPVCPPPLYQGQSLYEGRFFV